MADYSASDREFRRLVDAIRAGDLEGARVQLDDMLDDRAMDAREDALDDVEDDRADPDLERFKEGVRRGRTEEGLVFLERFLGHDFIGQLRGRA